MLKDVVKVKCKKMQLKSIVNRGKNETVERMHDLGICLSSEKSASSY
jgi:hypothetical protein